MLITTLPPSGAADFTILTEIPKFTNLTIFRQGPLRILQNLFPFDTSSERRCRPIFRLSLVYSVPRSVSQLRVTISSTHNIPRSSIQLPKT